MFDFIHLCDYLGTLAFAISGIRLASTKNFDLFGAYVVGFVTAVGGGTVRDILLDATPFWMLQPSYLIVSGLALLFVVLFRRQVVKMSYTVFFFDAVGLGLFVVVGLTKTIEAGFPMWVAIIMGTITGSFGGMIRDVLLNEVPLIFRKDIYALTCVLGGFVYWGASLTNLNLSVIQLLTAISVLLARVICVKYKLSMWTLKANEDEG